MLFRIFPRDMDLGGIHILERPQIDSDICNAWRHLDDVAISLSERWRRTECKRAGDGRNKPPGHG
jgi:hypothetical protein